MALFFPVTSAATASVETAAAVVLSLQALLPVITHLAAIPAIHYAWRIRAYRALAAVLNSFVVSVQYHLCQGWPLTACMGLSVATYRVNDYIWSPYVMAVGVEFMLRLYVYPWASLVSLPYLALIVFSTLANPFTIQTQLLILVVAVLLLFVKTAFLDLDSPTHPMIDVGANRPFPGSTSPRPLRIDVANRFHVPSLLLGAALMGVSLLGFFMEDATTYWLTHALLWHVPIYLSLYFIMIGTTRDVRGWYDPFALVCHASGYATDEATLHSKRDGDAPLDPVVFYSAHDGVDMRYMSIALDEDMAPFVTSRTASPSAIPPRGTHHYYATRNSSSHPGQRGPSPPSTAPLFRANLASSTHRK